MSTPKQTIELAKALFREERAINKLTGWFRIRETAARNEGRYADLPEERRTARLLSDELAELPLSISDNAVFAGTQRDAFARTYALINPSFRVDTFNGYCDPTAVFGDIDPDEEFPRERIEALRQYTLKTPYVTRLTEMYRAAENWTGEVIYFVEQVTGHLIPEFGTALQYGTFELKRVALERAKAEPDAEKADNLLAFAEALDAAELLANRYRAIAEEKKKTAEAAGDAEKAARFDRLVRALGRVPMYGARDLFEAIQSFMLLWEVMCAEQAPNPYAFSVGNADRIFEPYRHGLTREETAALFCHFLVFFNVGDRSWAISQNLIVGGRDYDGTDLTNPTSYALLDAYFEMNLPQPILSVRLHKNTPDRLYAELGRFFFSPGVLTPSLFNDDSLYPILEGKGVAREDIEAYSVAGCQEPLIRGKDNANTTNSWLNLGKILELTLTGGISTLTGKKLCDFPAIPAAELLPRLREVFYRNVQEAIDRMVDSANGASRALSNLRVPFLSCFMGGLDYGYDTRDTEHQGTKYNGSGCLIHGLSVVADSFLAVDSLLRDRPGDADRLIAALKTDFADDPELREYLLACPKFGNNLPEVDREAAEIANRVSDMVNHAKNYLGNPFRADWSSPTTHLTYGYWVGALPSGRPARDMLNYGVDPLYGAAESGLGMRMLSNMELPFCKMCGGYASHLGIDPKYFTADTMEEKGLQFRERVIEPLFFNPAAKGVQPFYLYVNVTTPEILRKLLKDPKKYAPSGVYIVRIHGTFVNFLDLSPDVQEDIIRRLDPASTSGIGGNK